MNTDMDVGLFVYGTLTDPERATAVLGADGYAYGPDAVVSELDRVEGAYPTLAPGPGDRTRGRILRTDRIEALDRYEGVDRGLYCRVSVPRADTEQSVETYVGNPDRLGVSVEWPGEGPWTDRVREYVRDREVTVRTV